MNVVKYELDPCGQGTGYIVKDRKPLITICAFINGCYCEYQDVTKLDARLDIVVNIESLGILEREHVLLKLNDDYRIGNMLKYLGIIKESVNRLGHPLYILENVKKEYVVDLYWYMDDLYSGAIESYVVNKKVGE